MGKAARRKQANLERSGPRSQPQTLVPSAGRPFGVAQALVMRARQALGVGDSRAAMTLLAEAVSRGASSPDVYNDLGVLLAQSGQYAAAVVQLEVALALAPRMPGVRENLIKALEQLALAALREGRWEQAAMEYSRLTRLDPTQVVYQSHAGAALREMHLPDRALPFLQRAVQMDPLSSNTHHNLGTVLLDLNRPECEGELALAIELDPRNANAHVNLAAVQSRLGRLAQARATLNRALQLAPQHGEAHQNLASILREQGEIHASVEHFRRARALRPRSPVIHSGYLLARQSDPAVTAEGLLAEHVEWGQKFAAPLDPGPAGGFGARDRDPERRLRVGYVSPDLRSHSVASFVGPLLGAHDPSRVSVYIYADGQPDAVTERLRARGPIQEWHDVRALGDEALAAQVVADEIDVLVDLAGHTGGNRLLTFARRPAPVQVTYCGYPNTTGVAAIGWRLTDEVADPVSEGESTHVETLWRLPHGFLCFEPDPGLGAELVAPARNPGTPLTFGSFNNFSKVSDEVLAVWAELLRAVPESRLLMKARASSDSAPRERLRAVLGRSGIADDRIVFAPYAATPVEAARLYTEVDVGLDPFPYNGTTTTCEALWMGVPVVALRGRAHRARVGASLLERIGCAELVATSTNDYVRIAVELARDRGRLESLRTGLRGRMAASPLTNAALITRDLEDAFREMWRRWSAAGTAT